MYVGNGCTVKLNQVEHVIMLGTVNGDIIRTCRYTSVVHIRLVNPVHVAVAIKQHRSSTAMRSRKPTIDKAVLVGIMYFQHIPAHIVIYYHIDTKVKRTNR